MRTKLGLVVLAAGCAKSPADHKLPSASLTPRVAANTAQLACGDSVAWNGDTTPDLVYAFTYNGSDEVVHAQGVFTAGGSDDEIAYTWDANENFTGLVENDGSYKSTIAETYDATDGLTDYATTSAWGSGSDGWDYAMSAFVAPWEPGREVITEAGQPSLGYTLSYDADGRLTTAVPDSGPATDYTYDDVARTITVDTGSGAWHGVITYDANDNELSEVWGGTDPTVIDSSTVNAWNGDALQTTTYSSGTQAAPTTLSVIEVDTIDYSCPNARVAPSHVVHTRTTPRGIARH